MAGLLLIAYLVAAGQGLRPAIIVAVACEPPAASGADRDSFSKDLAAIRRAGFNAIELPDRVAESMVKAAADAGLWVTGQTDERKAIRISLGPGALRPVQARLAFWSAIAEGALEITFDATDGCAGASVLALGETAGIATRNEVLFGPLRPRSAGVRQVDGDGVEVKLLVSREAYVIVGLNRSPRPTRARVTFDPDIPEAIWQNMETGAAVNFVMTAQGPQLEHTFAPHDALVLVIRKTLR